MTLVRNVSLNCSGGVAFDLSAGPGYDGVSTAAVAGVPLAPSYNAFVTDADHDGHHTFSVGWQTTAPFMIANEASGFGSIAGASFKEVNIAADEPIALAVLKVDVSTVTSADTFEVYLQQPLATSEKWSGTNSPDSFTHIGTDITGEDGTAVLKWINVTALVQAAIDHANWGSGDFLNFAFQTTNSAGNLQFGAVGSASSGTAAHLMVFTETDCYIGTDITDLSDAPFTNQSAWVVGGSATVSGGSATIPSGGSLQDTGVTIEANTGYYLTHQGSTGGIATVKLGGGSTALTNVGAGTRIFVYSGATPGDGLQLENSVATPVLTGPITLEKVESYDTLIHLDPANIGEFEETGGVYSSGSANATHPQWSGGDLLIETAGGGTGNGTARISTGNEGFGILGLVPGETYRMGWSGISNPSNTAFQIDCGASIEGIFGEPAYVDVALDGGNASRPEVPEGIAYAGDWANSGSQPGIVTFTGSMTITRVIP